jgi:hypothetical protein
MTSIHLHSATFDLGGQPAEVLDAAARDYAEASLDATSPVEAFMYDEAATYYRQLARTLNMVRVGNIQDYMAPTDDTESQPDRTHPYQTALKTERQIQRALDAAIAASNGGDLAMPSLVHIYQVSQDWCADLNDDGAKSARRSSPTQPVP